MSSSSARRSSGVEPSWASTRRRMLPMRPSMASVDAAAALSCTRCSIASGGRSSSTASRVSTACSSRPAALCASASGPSSAAAALPVAVGEQPQRGLVPVRRGGRRGVRRGGARLGEQGDRGVVALARVLGDVVGPRGRAGATPLERRGHALVGRQPPGGRRGVVHRAAHQRVAEGEPAAVARGAHHVGLDEPVERGHRLVRVQRGRGGREPGIEGIAGDGGALDQRARVRGQHVDLEPHRGHQRGREPAVGHARGAGQLLEEERVAAGLADHAVAQRRVGHGVDQRVGGVGCERARLELLPPRRGAGGVEQAGRRVLTAQREGEQERRARRPAQEMEDELDRRVVGPVQVVEQQRDGALAAQQLEQPAHRPVVAEALGGAGRGGRLARPVRAHRGGGGQDGGQVRPDGFDPARMQGRDVIVQRVHHEAERDVALVLGGAALEHQHPLRAGALAQRAEQRALADAGLAQHPHGARPVARLLHAQLERGELRLASQQLHDVRA